MTARSKTPRSQCLKDPVCNAWKTATGCGWLDSGAPCCHSAERRRFEQEDPAPTLPGLDAATAPRLTGNVGPQPAEVNMEANHE